MKRSLAILNFLVFAGCAPVSIDKYVESMSKDPATLRLQAAYMGGSLTLERIMPTPVPQCPPK